MAQIPSDDEVLRAVEKAGWLLEQEAARALGDRDFKVRPSWGFPDTDTPTTSRELDVLAQQIFLDDKEAKVSVSAIALVECKQSDVPYCAVGQDLPAWRRHGNPTEHTVPVRYLPREYDAQKQIMEYGHIWDVLGFRDVTLSNGQTNFRATQLTRLDRNGDKWSASNSDVFTSLVYPLAKAVRASQSCEKAPLERWDLNRTHHRRNRYLQFVLRFPVVLISSPLYVIDAGQSQPVVRKADWVRVQRHLDSDKIKGVFEFDVVTRGSFEEYIESVVLGIAKQVAAVVADRPLYCTGEEYQIEGAPDHFSKWSLPAPGLD